MLTVSHICVWVRDQDEARDFYIDKLGFELRQDTDVAGFRWLTLSPPDQPDLELSVVVPGGPPLDPHTADQVRELMAKGVIGGVIFRILFASLADLPQLVFQALYLFVQVNIVLAVFNMIPIPPLDGSAILFRVVSPATAWQIRPVLAQYGNILLLGLIFAIILTPLGRALSELIGGITNLLLGL